MVQITTPDYTLGYTLVAPWLHPDVLLYPPVIMMMMMEEHSLLRPNTHR